MGRSTRRTAAASLEDDAAMLVGDEQAGEPRDQADLEHEVWEEFQREHYEAVEMLPLQLRRQSSLIRELDEQGRLELSKVLEMLVQYKTLRERLASGQTTGSDGPPLNTRSLLSAIGQSLSEYVRTSEEKLSISSNAYDSVDRHVRAMDAMIKEQEAALALGARATVFGFHQGHQSTTTTQQNGAADGSPDPTKLRVDMPIDPNEPRYCVCRSVSYGEMVACDDQDCPNEWFHLACVGLTAIPKSRAWYCNECKEKREQARKKK